MILARTRSLLKLRGETTLPALAAELACDRDRVVAALEYWMHRGAVEADELADASCATQSCGGCPLVVQCDTHRRNPVTTGHLPPARRHVPVSYRWVAQ